MRIAIPVSQGRLCPHFGHCEQFALLDVDEKSKQVVARNVVEAPEHQPGLLPRWLGQQGVNLVIAGGMGMRAQQLFGQEGIEVMIGAPPDELDKVVGAWLGGRLQLTDNVCDH